MGAQDPFRDLQIFVQVVDSGSLTAAARVLGLSLPLVSRRLAELEAQVSVTLVHRTTRTLSVTLEGQAFYRRATRILAEYDAALDELSTGEAVRGVVRAVVPTVSIALGLFDAVRDLLAAHPELSLQLSVSDQPADPTTGGFDVVVHIGDPPDSQYIARRLLYVRPVLAATPEYLARAGIPEQPSDLSDHACLRFISDRPQDVWHLLDAEGVEHVVPVHGRIECDHSGALYEAMFAGLGIGLTAAGVVRDAEAAGQLQRVLPGCEVAGLTMVALMPPGRQRLPRVRAFVDFFEAFLHDRMHADRRPGRSASG